MLGITRPSLTDTDPLLPNAGGRQYLESTERQAAENPAILLEDAALQRGEGDFVASGDDHVTPTKRQLGTASAIFLIFNRVIGTGIFATPSVILRSSGSAGVTLLMWIVGTLVAATGTAVYMELGTGIPRSGGEKNYLEFMYRRPRFLGTCVFAVYACCLVISLTVDS